MKKSLAEEHITSLPSKEPILSHQNPLQSYLKQSVIVQAKEKQFLCIFHLPSSAKQNLSYSTYSILFLT